MRREDYIVLQAWMLGIDLTDKQEKVYAMIWGYSRDGKSVWRGTAADIAAWARCSERHAKRIIYELEDMGLIAHDVIAWSNGKTGGTRSEFWAILPEAAEAPEKGGKLKIKWRRSGRRCPKGVGTQMSQGGRDICVPTPLEGYQSIRIYPCRGSKNSARRARKDDHHDHHELSLFDQDVSGLPPGDPAQLELPFGDHADAQVFAKAWAALLRQPKWLEKTPDQLAIQLERFADTGDPVLCAYCCRLAVERGWKAVNDPSAIGVSDQDKVLAFADKVRACKEGAAE